MVYLEIQITQDYHQIYYLYSFLNASYFKGNDILKFDTRHVISLIKVNDEKEELDQFIEYLLTDGQTAIKNQGFIPID